MWNEDIDDILAEQQNWAPNQMLSEQQNVKAISLAHLSSQETRAMVGPCCTWSRKGARLTSASSLACFGCCLCLFDLNQLAAV